MTIYAIGDIQGCHGPFQRLLEEISFDPVADTLWLAGDLINRGPRSLAVLRQIKALGERAVTVLGNHDLSLLAVAEGFARVKDKDTFHDILQAPDREELLHWLRHRPLLHYDPAPGYLMSHAGLPPQWDLALARDCAREVERVLQGPDYRDFLANMFGSEPRRWHEGLTGMDRLRFTVNALTRMRFVHDDGSLDFQQKGPPGSQPKGLRPWFLAEGRRNADLKIVFGHWASLGYYRDRGVYALDSGCVWGGQLTALELGGEERVFRVGCD